MPPTSRGSRSSAATEIGLDGSIRDARSCLAEAYDAVERALVDPADDGGALLDALAAARAAATSLRSALSRRHDVDALRRAA